MEEREKKKSVCEKEREREEGALSSTPVERERGKRDLSLTTLLRFFLLRPGTFCNIFPVSLDPPRS